MSIIPDPTDCERAVAAATDPAYAGLTAARDALDGANTALADWRARGDHYVSAGHDALALIDAAMRKLYEARGALVDQILRDQAERAERVDALLARMAAERGGAQ